MHILTFSTIYIFPVILVEPCFLRRSRTKSAGSSTGTGSHQLSGQHHLQQHGGGSSFDSPVAAERLADYSRDSPLPGSPETDSGSESLKISISSGGGGGMPEAANQDSHLAALTNSLKVI